MTQDQANKILAQAVRYADMVSNNDLSYNNYGRVLLEDQELERNAYMKLQAMLQEVVK